MEVLSAFAATATGAGRNGHVKSSSGRIDLDARDAKEMGGTGEGTNPEELFAAAYAICFLSALRLTAGEAEIALDDGTEVTIEIRFGKDDPTGDFGLAGSITGYLPGLTQEIADDLMQQTHQLCPYSRAIRGNVDVDISAKV